jgi:hypothetical protein
VTLLIASRSVDSESIVELHGRLSGPEVAAFRGACASKPIPLRIDLANLSGASADGILALKEEQARGARLTNASPYVELLLGGTAPGSGAGGRGRGPAA